MLQPQTGLFQSWAALLLALMVSSIAPARSGRRWYWAPPR
jgi:hypothetical protein